MPKTVNSTPILDLYPAPEDLALEVLSGLASDPPSLPCKLFYDELGSKLFDAITLQPEYYPTRTEISILEDRIDDIADVVGEEIVLVEYGSGSTRKIEVLINALNVAAYVPIDISRWYLKAAARRLRKSRPQLLVRPVLADYSHSVPLPADLPLGPRVGFFPGGTIGNFLPVNAIRFLKRIAQTLGQGGYLLIGVDLKKDPVTLHAAYNDSAGLTAAFNLNLLTRINLELDADFDLDHWHHYAPYVPAFGRIEMHLVADADQTVIVAGKRFTFDAGTSIHTENSHKFTRREFAHLAESAGFTVERFWTDPHRLFSVQLLRVTA